jgi:hypothetical protein
MGNGWVLLIGIIFTVIFFFIWGSAVFSKGAEAVVKKAVKSRFERINEVEGALYADDLKIKTYNVGDILVDNVVEVSFYNNPGRVVQVTDIIFNNQSIFAFAPVGTTYREKAEFAIQVLKNNANQGALSKHTVSEVEHILIDVDNLNDYIKEGKVTQINNLTQDFAWKY